jgi:hypothetical protein
MLVTLCSKSAPVITYCCTLLVYLVLIIFLLFLLFALDRYRDINSAGGSWSTQRTACSSAPCPTVTTIEYLSADTQYEFRVSAINVNGFGPFTPSTAQQIVKTSVPGVAAPGSPRAFAGIETSYTFLRMKWELAPVSATEGPATSFRINYKRAGVEEPWSYADISGALSNYKIRNLVSGTVYELTVVAVNAGVNSGASKIAFSRTWGRNPPLKMPTPKILNRGEDFADVGWDSFTDERNGPDGRPRIITVV